MKTAYTQEQWTIDGTFEAQVGQVVADDVVAELRDGVPPVTMGDGILQVGEAVNHSYTGEALYTTFERTPPRRLAICWQLLRGRGGTPYWLGQS